MIRCLVWRWRLSIMKNATLMLSVLSNPFARCYDVRFLVTSPFSFGSIVALWHSLLSQVFVWITLLKLVGLLNEMRLWKKRQRAWTACGLILTPQCYRVAPGPRPTHWRVYWWLPKSSCDHAFCDASSQSSARKFSFTTRRLQVRPAYSSVNRAKLSGWCQLCSWVDA
jgi:hypothetical protein